MKRTAESRKEHRVFVAGLTLHVLAGTLATAATFVDFNWQSPAVPHFGDPAEPITAISAPLTGFILFYLVTNFPAMLAWSTSAGWAFNTGFIWLLAAAGFYDGLRKKRVRVIASSLQSVVGLVALGYAIAVGDRRGFHVVYGVETAWDGSVIMLGVAVSLTLMAAALAWLSPPPRESETRALSGWSQANNSRVGDDDGSEPAAGDETLGAFDRVKERRCGELGGCGICDLICSIILFILWIVLVALAVDFSRHEPATQCFAILPSNPAVLTMSTSLASPVTVADYTLTVNQTVSQMIVTRGAANTPVFSTLPGQAFIRIGYGPFDANNDAEMGTYAITDSNNQVSSTQTVASVTTDGQSVTVTGIIAGFSISTVQMPYTLIFSNPNNTNHLAFDVSVDDETLRAAYGNASTDFTRLYWIHDSTPDERFFGFGESYTYFDLKGTCLPIITREQGIGRGMQPFSYLINRFANEGAGSWQTTYSAVPHYVTNKLRSFFLTESFFMVFDLTQPDRMAVEIVSTRMTGRFLAENSFLDTIEQYTLYSGRMRPLPEWVGNGAVIGLQGGTATVQAQVNQLLALGVPLTGVWLQDWSGKRKTLLGDRLLWNWQVDETWYPGWYDMIAQYRSMNISVLTYINAYLADYAPNAQGDRVAQPMFAQAEALGCLIKKADNSTLIQISATSDFSFGTVDLTNPACEDWYMGIIQSNLMNVSAANNGQAYGALGWMADFGESIPFNAKLFSGTGAEVHNRFPTLWAQTCRKAINITAGGVDFSTQATFFTRSLWNESPTYTTLMWMGDQMQAFNRYDGLETVIPATVSMGFSGFALAHSDIGGYLGFSQLSGIIKLVRTQELLWRWMELSAFMDSMFRSHEGIIPAMTPQITSNNETMLQFARFANIFKALNPYRQFLMQDAAAKGYPLARHPLIHFQNDRNLDLIRTQVMLGAELMLCAVTHPEVSSTDCYLPAGSGTWISFFDPSVTYDSGANGQTLSCPAPLGRPCALYRDGSTNIPAAIATLTSAGFQF